MGRPENGASTSSLYNDNGGQVGLCFMFLIQNDSDASAMLLEYQDVFVTIMSLTQDATYNFASKATTIINLRQRVHFTIKKLAHS